MKLTDKLPATATRRHDSAVPTNRYHFNHTAFTRGDHRCRGGMLRSPAFGRGTGALTVVLGVLGIGSASVFVIDPLSPVVVVGFMALILFSIVVGWRVHRLSRLPDTAPAGLVDGASVVEER